MTIRSPMLQRDGNDGDVTAILDVASVEESVIMMSRRFVVVGLSVLSTLGIASGASAQNVQVMESAPKAKAVIEGKSSEFYVRFDRPVDHIHSELAILRNGQLVEKLVPRLESAPEVLFARAPTLPAGDYDLHWQVKTMTGVEVIQGNIPFSVKP